MLEYILGLILGVVLWGYLFWRPRDPVQCIKKPLVTFSVTEQLSDVLIDRLVDVAATLNLVLIVDVAADCPRLIPLKEVLKHKFLVSEKSEGRASLVRQLQPRLHVESDATVVERLTGKVPEVLRLDNATQALSVLESFRYLCCVTKDSH